MPGPRTSVGAELGEDGPPVPVPVSVPDPGVVVVSELGTEEVPVVAVVREVVSKIMFEVGVVTPPEVVVV